MLTTSNPRLWFTLSGLLIAFIILGGSCLGIASMVGDAETGYLRAANEASRWKLTNLPEQAFLWKNEPATDKQWAALLAALLGRRESWLSTLDEVLSRKAPERLAEVESALKAAEWSVSSLFDKAEEGVKTKDKDGTRWELTMIRRRLRAMEREVEGILQRIYQPDTLRENPDGSDPARGENRSFSQPLPSTSSKT